MRLLRLIPEWSWAFPQHRHHQLILAAIGTDRPASRRAAHDWLQHTNIDDASFRDHRLLLAVADRFGNDLAGHAAWPRLVGLQRMLWTRSRMALHQAKPALQRLADAEIELMLIKGAARLASHQSAGKQRVACDIDVVVRPDRLKDAFDILVGLDWIPAPGTSWQYSRENLQATPGINLFQGEFGDIDLHHRAFYPGQGDATLDEQLWATARRGRLTEMEVRIPRPEDCIAIAIAHGGLDGHTHSDWLIDCATILNAGSIDWHQLLETVQARRITVAAAITFRYFRDRLGFAIPAAFLQTLESSARHRPARLACGMIQARPKERSGWFGQSMRWIVKKQRKRLARRQAPGPRQDRLLRVRKIWSGKSRVGQTDRDFVTTCLLSTREKWPSRAAIHVELVLDIEATACRRRLELEINTPRQHLCRIRFRNWVRRDRPWRLRVTGTIPPAAADSQLELVSRPSRQLRSYASEAERQKYERLAFRVVSCRLQPGVIRGRAA